MSSAETSQGLPHQFPPTRWSLVLEARRSTSIESQAALETICRSYWYPLYAHVRRCGYSPHDAQDLTQEFFCRLLEKRWLETADQEKGRLRSFLIVALKNFMAKEWRKASAQKRGGGQVHVPVDTAMAEGRYVADPANHLQPDEVFDREWALTLIGLTVERLQKEFDATGKRNEFEALKDCLMAERGSLNYQEISGRMKTTEGAARVAVHRLRKRFREIYREEITQTLSKGSEVDTELRHLAAALALR